MVDKEEQRALMDALMEALRTHGFPEDFDNNGVIPMFDYTRACAFLTNADLQVATLHDGKLQRGWART